MGSCTECLACDLAGKPMAGHDRFDDGEPVPPELAQLTRGIGFAVFVGDSAPRIGDAVLPGYKVADALDAIIAGAEPYQTGIDLWTNRNN